MEYNIPFSSPHGGSFINAEQDFCYGAKTLTSLHPPAFPTSPTSSDCSEFEVLEWMKCDPIEIEYKDIEAFNDVILPDAAEFDSDDLFKEFSEDQNGENYTSIESFGTPTFDSNFQLIDSPIVPSLGVNSSPTTSNITIKLKRVKYPKSIKHKNIKLKQKEISMKYNNYDYEILQAVSPHDQTLLSPHELSYPICNQSLDNSYALTSGNPSSLSFTPLYSNNFPSTIDDDFLNDCGSNENGSSCITLKDVIGLEDADILLENCLSDTMESDISQNSLPSININSHDYNSDASSWEEIHSPLSISSSVLASPSFLDITSPTSNIDDRVSSPLSSHSETIERKAKRSRPPRQKLSAESRYLRKKEQNKEAALRYRMKKKLDDQYLIKSLEEEEDQKKKLQKSYSSLQQEIIFMKKLMRETFITKNLVSIDAFK